MSNAPVVDIDLDGVALPQLHMVAEEHAESEQVSSGAARRRRLQKQRVVGKHVAWLAEVCQISASHHSGARIATLIADVKALSDEVAALKRSLKATVATTDINGIDMDVTSSDAEGMGTASSFSPPVSRETFETTTVGEVVMGHNVVDVVLDERGRGASKVIVAANDDNSSQGIY